MSSKLSDRRGLRLLTRAGWAAAARELDQHPGEDGSWGEGQQQRLLLLQARIRTLQRGSDLPPRGVLILPGAGSGRLLFTLRAACDEGSVPRSVSNARMDRFRYCATYPQPVHHEGDTHYYDPEELAQWYRDNPQLRG